MASQAPRTARISPLFVLVLISFVLLPGLKALAGLYLDVRWFGSVGFGEILRVQLTTQLGLFVGAGTLAGGVLFANLRLAQRMAKGSPPLYLYDPDGLPRINLGAFVQRLIMPASLVLGVLTGLLQAPEWQTWQLAIHSTPFGKNDAIFGRDVAFYVFALPFWNALSSFALFTVGASTVAVAAMYVARGALQVVDGETRIGKKARLHLSVLVSLVLVTLCCRAYLETFDILYSTVGPMAGASYADVNAKLPALRMLIAAAAVGAVLVLVGARRESLGLAFAAAVLYLGAQGIVLLYPGAVHNFSVRPNELEREAQFLKHNIDATRAGYGLDAVSERELDAKSTLTASDVENNADTIDNIRLWDRQPLLDAFGQIQEIRTQYDFAEVDNDRYMIDGKLRQTMLSPRELPIESLPHPSWINQRLAFTHGYGITLGPVNEASPEGLPVMFVQDIPPVSRFKEVEVKQPAIYFGERSSDYAIVRTRGREFDYPSTKGEMRTDYAGRDGVRFDSPLVRLALATAFSSVEVLLSDDIDSDSRVLLYRNIRTRLARIAPFLSLDPDPYMVVRKDGRLAWIFDAYTISNRYPYSEPSTRYDVNYIRNSVKAVIDAYDGTVTLYVADEKDPFIRSWQKAFPNSFTPLAKMPSDLRAHLRYPELAFDLQTEMFSVYHMGSSEQLYNREDQWEIPVISNGDKKEPMSPYYTVMKLPGEPRSEFILMLPFTPKRKDNLAAWMVARSDGDQLGQLVVYRFPKDRLVFGPQQVVTRINQDAEIARQISLWDQRGSKAEFGTLLVVPIEESLLYVRPLYLRSEGGKIPELKRVIVALENQISMASSLREAIDAVFKEKRSADGNDDDDEQAAPPPDLSPQQTAQPVAAVDDKADAALSSEQRALVHLERALAAQREGDWARYGEELRQVEAILRAAQPAAKP